MHKNVYLDLLEITFAELLLLGQLASSSSEASVNIPDDSFIFLKS